MSDVDLVLSAFARVHAACRQRAVPVPGSSDAVSPHQARLLGHLDPVDPGMVTELAEYLGVTPSTMSLNLKRLERAGLVARERDPADRRVMNVRLTELGVRTREAHRLLDRDRVDRVLGALRPELRPRALEGLLLLADAADALVAAGDDFVEALTGEGAG